MYNHLLQFTGAGLRGLMVAPAQGSVSVTHKTCYTSTLPCHEETNKTQAIHEIQTTKAGSTPKKPMMGHAAQLSISARNKNKAHD